MSNDKTDPFAVIGNEALVELAFDVQVQLEKATNKGMRPVLYLLVQQRKRAVDALGKMVEIDVVEKDALRSLQAEVRLYLDLVENCRLLLKDGRDAIQQINEEDRAEMADIIGKMSPEEQRLYSAEQRTED